MTARMLLAVLAPRRVNASGTDVDPPAAVALLAQSRDFEFYRHREEGRIPAAGPGAGWEVVDAFQRSRIDGTASDGADELVALLDVSEDPYDIAALAVMARHALADTDRLDDADAVLRGAAERLRDRPGAPPATRAVVAQQLSLCLAELGLFEDAVAVGETVERILEEPAPTTDGAGGVEEHAAAVAEAAAAIRYVARFNLRNWALRLGEYKASDRPTVPLPSVLAERSLPLAGAVADVLDDAAAQRLESAAGPSGGMRWRASDPTDDALASYLFAAGAVGEWSATASASRALAHRRLLAEPSDAPPEWSRAEALRLLRRGRDDKGAIRAARIIRAEGPLAALHEEAVRLVHGHIPAPQRRAALGVLRLSAPLLETEHAQDAMARLLDPADMLTRPSSRNDPDDPGLWPTVGAMLYAGAAHEEAAMAALAAAAASESPLLLQDLAGALRSVEWAEVTPAIRERWLERIDGDDRPDAEGFVTAAALGLAAVEPRAVRELLTRRFRRTRTALVAASLLSLPDAEALDDADGASIRAMCVSALRQSRDQAASGSYSFGGVDLAWLCGVLSTRRPQDAAWAELGAYLSDPHVALNDKTHVLDYFADLPALPDGLLDFEVPTPLPGTDAGLNVGSPAAQAAAVRFALRVGRAGPAQIDTLLQLEGASGRAELASSLTLLSAPLGPDTAVSLGLHLSADTASYVRAAAAEQLAGLAAQADVRARGRAVSRIADLITGDPGIDVPLAAARAARSQLQSEEWETLVQKTSALVAAHLSPSLRRLLHIDR